MPLLGHNLITAIYGIWMILMISMISINSMISVNSIISIAIWPMCARVEECDDAVGFPIDGRRVGGGRLSQDTAPVARGSAIEVQ